MTEERFYTLAEKMLAGEASPEEEKELDALVTSRPERQRELLELQQADRDLREFGLVAAALDTQQTTVPADRLRELKQAVRTKFGTPAGKARIQVARSTTLLERFL